MLSPLPEKVEVIIANLPYVQKADLAGMPSVKYEPVLALDGGESGLDEIFQLCHQLPEKLLAGGLVLMEIGMGQGPAVTDFIHKLYPMARIEMIPDLAGIDRVVKLMLRL
jgi:release factor glutamine methyltransferase